MTNTEQTKAEKKIYTKPILTEVRLVAGEAVLGTCKNAFGGYDACQGVDAVCYPGDSSHS